MRLIQFIVLLFFTVSFFAQENRVVDFTKISIEITPIFDSKEIRGSGTYNFQLKAKTDSIYIDAINMTFSYVSLNGKQIEYSNSGRKLAFKAPEKLQNHELIINYLAKPKQTVYFIEKSSNTRSQQVWTQGQGKYTSHWLPSFDDMTEKVEFNLTINSDERHTVIANGKLIKKNTEDGLTDWYFNMKQPMSSYLAAFVVGNFNKKELKSTSGIPIELYYEPKDSLKVEPTYRYTKRIFDFLEKEIGVAYPWQNYKQVPVQDFLYAGMENTGTTVFSNTYMIDSTAFIDKNYVNVNAHELAHQWFGNLVTEESGKHHWLHEGFATYYAYLTEQHLFGGEHLYWKLYDTAKTLHNLSNNGGGEALTNPNANSLTFYEKGAWALVMLKDRIGRKAFNEGVKAYLNKYQFKNVTITDFLKEIEFTSKQDLSDFRKLWLDGDTFPWELVKEKLKKESESLALVFQIEDKFQQEQSDDFNYEKYWNETNSLQFRQYLIKQHYKILPNSVIEKAFLSKDIMIRQALSNSLYDVSNTESLTPELVSKFETLLEDKSYITIENTLIKLWSNFPKNRAFYFSKTENIVGLPNKNVRLLWLTLALVTPDFRPGKKETYYKELNEYTLPIHHFEVRQLAFEYLNQIQAMDNKTLINLIKASQHHVWQFKKFSRRLIRKLAENNEFKERLLNLDDSLNIEQRNTLDELINK